MKPGTALITGASGGIGLALAERFAADGHNVVLVARNQSKLEHIANKLHDQHGVATLAVAADLSDLETPEAIIRELTDKHITVDFLVNNAGFGGYGPFVATDKEDELGMIDVNVRALTELTKLVLPDMFARQHGRILNVASTAAFQSGPLMAVYFATKAYVLSFSEALQEELRGSGVTVTCLAPGPTATGFEARATEGKSGLFGRDVMSVDRVAGVGYRALHRGRTLVIPGARNRLTSFMIRFLPRQTVTHFVHRFMAPDR